MLILFSIFLGVTLLSYHLLDKDIAVSSLEWMSFSVAYLFYFINHHQTAYNEVESNLEEELNTLYRLHPEWSSDDPVTKDMSNSTGWNINYLAKQYLAQLKHQPLAQAYEEKIDDRNRWLSQFRFLSPAMIVQSALSDLAGTSTKYYRSYLRQTQEYAHEYRQYVFQGLFTNHAFSSAEIEELPTFSFNRQRVMNKMIYHQLSLCVYIIIMCLTTILFIKFNIQYLRTTIPQKSNRFSYF